LLFRFSRKYSIQLMNHLSKDDLWYVRENNQIILFTWWRKRKLRGNSIDDKDSDIFPDEFQNTNFSFIQFLIIIENWLNNNVDEKFKQKQMFI
jgi:hypothetical protein